MGVQAARVWATIWAMTERATPAPGTSAAPARRPFALLVLVGLLLLKAGVLVAVILDIRLSDDNPLYRWLRLSADLRGFVETLMLSQLILGLLAALLVGSAVGLVLLRRDGWLMAMVLTGLFVAIDIAGFIGHDADYVWMAANIVTVFYLNQTDVRAAVGVSTAPLVPGAHA